MKFISCFLPITCCLFASCASIVSKSDWPVTINSNPTGATVVVKKESGELVHQGVTPTTVTLHSSAGYFKAAAYRMEFSKKGYPAQVVEVRANMNGWYMGNLVFGGLIGFLVVDPASGAMWKLDDHVTGNLAPLATLDNGNGKKLRIVDRNSLSPDLQRKLIALH